jgi:hypothetical protein
VYEIVDAERGGCGAVCGVLGAREMRIRARGGVLVLYDRLVFLVEQKYFEKLSCIGDLFVQCDLRANVNTNNGLLFMVSGTMTQPADAAAARRAAALRAIDLVSTLSHPTAGSFRVRAPLGFRSRRPPESKFKL